MTDHPTPPAIARQPGPATPGFNGLDAGRSQGGC